jgi:hypothetical protein
MGADNLENLASLCGPWFSRTWVLWDLVWDQVTKVAKPPQTRQNRTEGAESHRSGP